MVQSPSSWIASVTGRAPRLSVNAWPSTQSPGRNSAPKHAALSAEKRPLRSCQGNRVTVRVLVRNPSGGRWGRKLPHTSFSCEAAKGYDPPPCPAARISAAFSSPPTERSQGWKCFPVRSFKIPSRVASPCRGGPAQDGAQRRLVEHPVEWPFNIELGQHEATDPVEQLGPGRPGIPTASALPDSGEHGLGAIMARKAGEVVALGRRCQRSFSGARNSTSISVSISRRP